MASQFYTVQQLTSMRLPGYPTSARAWYSRVEKEGWEYREVVGRGPGGIRREYQPPAPVLELIRDRQAGELPAPAPVQPSHAAVMAAGARALTAEIERNHQALKAGAVAVAAQAEQRACATYITLKLLEHDAVRAMPSDAKLAFAEEVYAVLATAFGQQAVLQQARKHPEVVDAAIHLILSVKQATSDAPGRSDQVKSS